ncbi:MULTISPECIES: hypothetical protein [unclassified Streptomyces]|uniref:hypothetical protein n=1 Tax=unclassified Streptomyces TaxID=2593676 RepID=UPI00382421DB
MADDPEPEAAVPPVPGPDEAAGPPAPHDVGGPEEAEATGPAATGPPSRSPDESDEDDRGYDELRRVHQLVNNNFYGVVDASGAAFGFGTARSPGLAPGVIEHTEVDRALRFYLPPTPCFDEALAQLRATSLVVLTGEDDCGRGAGALALLREVLGGEAELRSLSPANALGELVRSPDLKPGQGYVILDYVGELNVQAVQAYAIGRLSAELGRKGSYLVITASGPARRRLALREHCVTWAAPDPVELFSHCRDRLPPTVLAPDAERDLHGRVAGRRRPADIVAAARVLSEDGADKALETLRDRCRELVRDFFSQQPSADDLIPLAALAFLEGIPERTFEKECAALVGHARDWERGGGTGVVEPDDEPRTVSPGTVAQQSRARWRERAVGIVTTEQRPDPGRPAGQSERRLVFTDPRAREFVIAELHDLYGYELWYPLRRWLNDLALTGDLDTRTEVARGVAVLARHAPVEVDQNMLTVWSGGLINQRVTAALTLQFMSGVEHLAPQALDITLGWLENTGESRAMTAAMAFTGRLGSLYRLDTLKSLWLLTQRGERIAVAAHRSLVLLLQNAEQDPDRARFVLRYTRTVIARTRPGSKQRAIALRIALQLLDAERLESPEPLSAALLRTLPDGPRQLGSLWVEVLHSTHRGRAVGALCRTLVHLRDDPSATDAVRRLGETLRDAMNDRQWGALRHHLSIALRHPDYAIPGADHLAQVLLGSLRATTPRSGRRFTAALFPTPPLSSTQGGRST